MQGEAGAPEWFTPLRMLCVFTAMSLVVYLDRGMIASTPVNGQLGGPDVGGSGIQGAFQLTNFQDGCLPAAFMVGLIVASPTFAAMSKSIQPFKLVGAGLLTWTLAVAACAATWDFWSILCCRMLVGVGEASFVVLAAPFIDEHAPPALKSLWIAIFLMANPVGYALGYIYGGVVGALVGWRLAFLIEALLMTPFVALGFLSKPIPFSRKDHLQLRQNSSSHSGSPESVPEHESLLLPDIEAASSITSGHGALVHEASPSAAPGDSGRGANGAALRPRASVMTDAQTLLKQRVYVLAVLGNTLQTALLGMFAYWGPKAVTFIFRLPSGRADVIFGSVTVLSGIAGTLAGGLLLDGVGSSARAAAGVCLLSCSAGFMLLEVAFHFCRTLAPFVAVFAAGEVALFMLQSPITRIILVSVPPGLRPLAFGLQTVAIHVLGDVPSPPLAGWIHDHVFDADDVAHPQSWRATSSTFNSILLVASVFFLACLSSAPATSPTAQPNGADAHPDGAAPSTSGATQRVADGGQRHGAKRHRRHRTRRMMMPRAHRDLETVEEVASSVERGSSMETSSVSSIRGIDKDENG